MPAPRSALLTVTAPLVRHWAAARSAPWTNCRPCIAAGLAVTIASWRLEAAQADLTKARLQERKVIRRELHDGLGPSLTGLRLGLQGARNLVATDPAAAEQILGSLQVELDRRSRTCASCRTACLPPVLVRAGAPSRLTELAARHREVRARRAPSTARAPSDSPREVANAAYAIISEAVTNVARHSGADPLPVNVTIEHGEPDPRPSRTTAPDSPPTAAPGVGTSSMRERAHELGGSFEIEPRDPHGTTVSAVSPDDAPTPGYVTCRATWRRQPRHRGGRR